MTNMNKNTRQLVGCCGTCFTYACGANIVAGVLRRVNGIVALKITWKLENM